MNNVSLIGRLTTAPELKYTQSNTAYTRFSIAVDRAYTKQGEERQADFINIIAWSKTAEFICKYFMKGQRIGITGEIRTGSYTDQSGNKRYTFDVVANNVYFCESKSTSTMNQTPTQSTQPVSYPTVNNNGFDSNFSDMPSDEDLPF